MSSRPISLVTGGSGFIGSHMVDFLLEQGHEVRVIDNLVSGHLKNLSHLENDDRVDVEIRDVCQVKPDDALFKGVSYVYHFAGIGDIVPSIEDPYKYMLNNVIGTVSVLEAARAAQVKSLVYAASSSCYGLAEELPTTEQASISPQYPYALSKYQGEQAVHHWGQVYHLPVNSVRIFNAYGPRSRTTGAYGAVFGVFLKQKLAGKPFTVVGDGSQRRDFVYVTDVARAFYTVATSKRRGEVFNLGAGNPQSVNHLVDLLDGVGRIALPKRPGEPDCTFADISKLTELGWAPKVSFEDGVSRMLTDINLWQDAPLWDEASISSATQTWFEMLSR